MSRPFEARHRLATAALVATVAVASVASPAAADVTNVNGVQVIVNGLDPAATSPPRDALPAPRDESPKQQQRLVAAGAPRIPIPTGDPHRARLLAEAERYLGAPYRRGGTSPAGFDAAGFVQYVFRDEGVPLPRTAALQYDWGRPVRGAPSAGDLVFFQTSGDGPTHVGIALGNGWFVDSVGTHVQYSTFANRYFRDRYLGARRVLEDE